jgi:hypothetical protein
VNGESLQTKCVHARMTHVRGRRRFGAHGHKGKEVTTMTLLWFIVWLISNLIGDSEPLTFDPVNWWTGALLFAIALDLSAQHAMRIARTRS